MASDGYYGITGYEAKQWKPEVVDDTEPLTEDELRKGFEDFAACDPEMPYPTVSIDEFRRRQRELRDNCPNPNCGEPQVDQHGREYQAKCRYCGKSRAPRTGEEIG